MTREIVHDSFHVAMAVLIIHKYISMYRLKRDANVIIDEIKERLERILKK